MADADRLVAALNYLQEQKPADPLESFRSLAGLRDAYERRVQPIINNARQTFSTGGAMGDLLRSYGEAAAPGNAAALQGMGIPFKGPMTAPREEGFSSGENFRPMGDPQQQFAGQLLGDPMNVQPMIAPAARGAVAAGKYAAPAGKYAAERVARGLEEHMAQTGLLQQVAPQAGAGRLSDTTVMRPQRNAFPGVYGNPREMVQEAASRVAPEDPLLKQLFGVTRDDIWEISQHGQRQGNLVEQPFKSAANPKGARSAEDVMNPRNERRILDIISESSKVPELHQPMASWYVTDPLFLEYVKQFGKEEAVRRFEKANTLMGMASPASEVMSEINRGSAANWLSTQGRFNDFKKYGGVSNADRGTDFPSDMAGIIPHPYHPTAQAGPMEKYLASGRVDMNSAKVPTYIQASGVPETGFQTRWPVGDAHWSRIMGLADTRGATTSKCVPTIPGAAATVPEMATLSPFFRDRIAAQSGLEAVPAQGVIWGAGSGATGVTSQIGAGKLELIAKQIGAAARRMNVSPEQARDMIIRGEAHYGFVTPEVASMLAGGALAGTALTKYLKGEE